MKPVFLSCLAVCVLLPPNVHIFEDGFVERTMAVVIRDRTVNVEYSIGLNQNTLKQILNSWSNEPANSEPTNSEPTNSEPTNSERADSPDRLNDDQPTVDKELAAEQADPQSDQIAIAEPTVSPTASLPNPAGGKDPNRNDKPVGAGTRPSAQPEDDRGNPQAELAHFIDAKLFEALQKGAPANISKRIAISCNGQAVTPTSASIGPAPRHPFSLVVRFEFQLPDATTCELKFSDKNFLDQAGAVRYALKTKGRTVILQSDVAPILIRSERVELEPVKKSNPIQTTMSAKVAVLPHTRQ